MVGTEREGLKQLPAPPPAPRRSSIDPTRTAWTLPLTTCWICRGTYPSGEAAARGEGERVLALESREGTRASRRVEDGHESE